MVDIKIEDLLEMIPVGESQAISRRDLAKQLGVSDRKARDMIHETRKQYAVLSNTSTGGYYLPGNKDEAVRFIKQQTSYIANINYTIGPVRRWLETKNQKCIKFDGQRSIRFEWDRRKKNSNRKCKSN